VGVGNPAEETYRYPNKILFAPFGTIEPGASLSTSLTVLSIITDCTKKYRRLKPELKK
jgi:hypothetical protein